MKYRRNAFRLGLVGACVLALLVGMAMAGNNPVDENWWPSEFGADDHQADAVRYITPEKVVQAAQLVKKGMTATLGVPYYNGMPLVPGCTVALSIRGCGTPAYGFPYRENDHDKTTFMDELLTAESGQVGTQWDGLGHPMIKGAGVPDWEDGNYFYNGFRLEDVGGPRGFQAVGNEHLAEIGFFTRGILIDIAALKGVDRLDKGYAIIMADFNTALEAQGIDDASQGAVVLFHAGWNSLWKDYSEEIFPIAACAHATGMCTPEHPDGRDPFHPPFTPAGFLRPAARYTQLPDYRWTIERGQQCPPRDLWGGSDGTPMPFCELWVHGGSILIEDDEPVTTPPIPLPW